MRFSILFSFCLFWIPESHGKHSLNLIHNHIRKYVNFSVDPCEDFYLHACPASSRKSFLARLDDIKDASVAKHKPRQPFYQRFTQKMLLETNEVLIKLNSTPRGMYYADIASITLDGFEDLNKDQKDALLVRIGKGSVHYNVYKKHLNSAFDGNIASKLFHRLEVKAKKMFATIKAAIRKSIGKTPWTKTYNSTNMFQKTLDDINFYTFSDAREAVEIWIQKYNEVYDECLGILTGTYGNQTGSAFCDVLAIHKSRRVLDEVNIKVLPYIRDDVISDKATLFNINENIVYISNSILLLFSSDFSSDLYGSIGFSLLHEIFHSLVFGADDRYQNHPLIPYWTKNSECVVEQVRKTCETFSTIRGPNWEEQGCDPHKTFEEDAADIAAYRIAWDLYRKSFSRKTMVPNSESLNKEQLFFYGASTILCFPNAMKVRKNDGNVHSNTYQRVNTLMSQMPAFSRAFSCNPTDKMVLNKASHCVLYGPNAPMTRKNSDN